jgi:peroxiredoxin
LQFVGIAIDERDKVQSFAREFGINYPVLLGTIDTVEISRQAGNTIGALPFTLVLDRSGRIVSRELGKAQEMRLEALLQPLL